MHQKTWCKSSLRTHSKYLKISWRKKKVGSVKCALNYRNSKNAVWSTETGAIHNFISDEKVNVTSLFTISG